MASKRPRAGGGTRAAPPFRDATLVDLDALLALERVCYPPEQAYGRLEYRYALGVARAVNLALDGKDAAMPVAFGGAFLHAGRKTGNVFTVNVHPAHRGRGIARALLAALEARMRAAGMARSVLEVNVANEPAIRLYEACGYARVERIKNYYQSYAARDAFRYAKEL